ncbi:hypothetical protein JQ628_11480 [Bradyrhizobium lablabi]|nr:hypothetical protein [Bradyrhizobium lablabi]MBR1122137.1 hypothetical protein [Bradyrhizobium lablabi]
MLSYGPRYVDGIRVAVGGREAIVDPEVTRREVIDRIRSGEYRADEIDFIHHITMNDAPRDVKDELIAEAQVRVFPDVPEFDHQSARFDHQRDLRKHYSAAE